MNGADDCVYFNVLGLNKIMSVKRKRLIEPLTSITINEQLQLLLFFVCFGV